jgi:PAS domain S-box-containing protein
MREYGIGDPLNKLKIVGDAFSRLMTIEQPAGPNTPEGRARGELQGLLTTQLLLASQDLLTRFLNLNGEINQKLIKTQRLSSVLDILALAALGILLIINMGFLQRSVVDPILKLHEGAEIIGAGRLDHKIGIASRDEVGQLSQAFDRMTANLQEITVSRDELAKEVEERKRVEGALLESREDLSRAQAVAHIGSWRLNVRKNELTWSDENHRIFGIPPGSPMTYESFLGAVHSEDREYVDREWMAALQGKPYDIEHRIMVDGTVKWVRERAELEVDSAGRLLGGFGTTQDITERKRVEAEIKHLASFPQMNPAPVIEIDLSGAITYYNQAAFKALEKLGPEAGWGGLLPEDLGEIAAAAREKKTEFYYREVRVKDTVFGQNIYFAEAFQVLRIYCLDITSRKQAEERLQRTLVDLARSNQDLEEFAYVASHDLQEPLRKMASFSEMLADRYQGRLDDRADKYLGYITDGAKRMKDLINDLLTFSRVGKADFRLISTDMNDILKETLNDIQPLVREEQAEITHEVLPTLKVNPHQMGQLLQNLIANAIKFHGDQPPRIHVSARQEGREWVMAVHDNGIGFDPQYAEGIFKVFRRLHTKEEYPGTGIGLAICKKIMERHGGRIWAGSEPGGGATFYFTIPV